MQKALSQNGPDNAPVDRVRNATITPHAHAR